MDPEVFITAQGPYVYYNRYIPKTENTRVRPEGIWRVDARIGSGQNP